MFFSLPYRSSSVFISPVILPLFVSSFPLLYFVLVPSPATAVNGGGQAEGRMLSFMAQISLPAFPSAYSVRPPATSYLDLFTFWLPSNLPPPIDQVETACPASVPRPFLFSKVLGWVRVRGRRRQSPIKCKMGGSARDSLSFFSPLRACGEMNSPILARGRESSFLSDLPLPRRLGRERICTRRTNSMSSMPMLSIDPPAT